MSDKAFFFTVTYKELKNFERELKDRKIPYDTLVWCGYFPMENSKIVLDFGGEDDNRCFIASKDFLQKSNDEIFVRLNKPTDKDLEPMPEAKDIFKIVEFENSRVKENDAG